MIENTYMANLSDINVIYFPSNFASIFSLN